jgi:hypothetical protein
VRVFKNTWFARFARKEGISDEELRDIVDQLEAGQARQQVGGADYGGDVYKIRVARPGEGKSGGYRVIVFFRSEDKTFFHYAYPRSHRGNISEKELRSFKQLAKRYLAMTDERLTKVVKVRELIEI